MIRALLLLGELFVSLVACLVMLTDRIDLAAMFFALAAWIQSTTHVWYHLVRKDQPEPK